MEKGVLYIAFGENFVKEMLYSAESVKKHNPNLHITAFSDREIDSLFIDDYKIIEVNHIRAKVDYVAQTPYNKTIFLDSDTIVDYNIEEMFEILDHYDFAICHDLARKRKNVSRLIPEYAKIPYAFSEVNPGVMVFEKTDEVVEFFDLWKKYFYRYFSMWPYEQPTFRVALWESGLDFYILPPEYNIRSKGNRDKQRKFHHEFGADHLAPRIYHMHADNRINQGIYEVESVDDALEYCKNNLMEY
jgi:hypothetical protein